MAKNAYTLHDPNSEIALQADHRPYRLIMLGGGLGILALLSWNNTPIDDRQASTPALAIEEIVIRPARLDSIPTDSDTAPPAEPDTAATSPEPAESMNYFTKEIHWAADKYGLPPQLLANFIWQESRFNPNAVSHKGAEGLLQLMPGTRDDIKRWSGIEGEVNMFDPVQNLDFGAYYMRYLLNRFAPGQPLTPEVVRLLAVAYHGGPGAAIKFIEAGQDYSRVSIGPLTKNYSYAAGILWERYLSANAGD